MLTYLVQFSLRFRWVVIALATLMAAYGVFVSSQTRLDVFPEFVQPQAAIQTEAPGLTSEQVEVLVTRPVENALNGALGMESIRSESIPGLSVVTAVFKEGTDIHLGRQVLTERLAELAGDLPAGTHAPKMEPLTSSTMDLLKFGIVSDKLSPMALRTFADWTIKPRLLSVPGVARINVFGGEVRQLQIQIKPERLVFFNLSIQDVLAAAKESTGVRGAGFVETEAQRIVVESEGQALTAGQLGEVVVVQKEGRTVRLKDVAAVVEGAEPKFGDAIIMGKPGVLMTLSSQYGANTLVATEAVEQALDEIKPAFAEAGIQYIGSLHRPANFIETAVRNMKDSLLIGAILVAIILFLFLLDLRTALISFTAIPLSLLAAVLVLDRWGVAINTITLGGFAVAIGVVVDDAIIDVENILRRLRENMLLPFPRSMFAVVLDASIEVRSAVVYASFVVALVFLPVLMMSGLQGRFFAPLGVAFILAILASLVVALTVTPALCLTLLSSKKVHQEPVYIRRLKHAHGSILKKVGSFPKTVIALALVLFLASLATIPYFGGEFLPEFREGHLVAQVAAAPGLSLPEMVRLGIRISAELRKNPHIKSVEQQIGRAEMGEDTWGPHLSEFHIELNHVSAKEESKIQDEVRSVFEQFPGIDSEVLTFLGDRLSETISGETAQVVINVFGDNLDQLDQKAADIKAVLTPIRGAADIQVKAPPGAPRLAVKLRNDRLAQFGFRPVQVLEAVETALQGVVASQVYDGNRVFDVVVVLPPENRREPEQVGNLMLSNAEGLRMPLRELADVYLTEGRYEILHDGARRRQTVTCNPSKRDVSSFVAEAKSAIAAKVKFPPGVYVVFGGAAEEQSKARRELMVHSSLAGVGILLLLGVVFRNGRNLLLVLMNLPFALVGGLLAVFAAGYYGGDGHPMLSLGTLVGFVTLFGITMRNSIMMISHCEHLVRYEGMVWGQETAVRAATERLAPVLMTALVTGLGLLPLALGTGEPGREIEGPMAIVILGGLVTSTLLNLLVLPTLALRYGRFEKLPEQPSQVSV